MRLDCETRREVPRDAPDLTRLLGIENRKERNALTRTAIRNRWGVTALEIRFQAMKGGRRLYVGQDPRPPTIEEELLVALSELCGKWENFCAGAKAKLPDDMTARVEAVKTVKADNRAKKSSTGEAKK